MKKAIHISFVGLAILCLHSLVLNSQESLTLPKAISIALENNLNVRIAEKNIAIAENNNTWAAAGRAPTVSLNIGFNNSLTNDQNPASFLQGTYYIGSLGGSLDANWILYSGGRIAVAKDQLDILLQQERLNKDVDVHSLIRQVVQEYYAVLFQLEGLQVLQASHELSAAKLDYENVKKEFGRSNSLDILQFQNALVNDSINIVSQRIQVETAERNLLLTLRLPLDTQYTFDEKLSVSDEAIDGEKLMQALEDESYTLRSLYLLSDISALNARLAEAQRKPTISLNGSIGASRNGFQFFEDNPNTGEPFEFQGSSRQNGALGLNLNWDLYAGGTKRAAVKNAKLEAEIALLSIEEAKVRLTNQLDILVQNYNTQRSLLKLSDDQISLAEENLAMLDERFKSGLVTSLDYRNIQLQYLNAAFAKVNAIYNLILTKSEIDFLVGKFESTP